MFFYLLFINVDYPKHVEDFLRVFSIATLDFLPNPFSDKEDEPPSEEEQDKTDWLPSPGKFYENEYSGNFLQSSGYLLPLIAGAIAITLILKVFVKLYKKKNKLASLADSAREYMEWSGTLRIWTGLYIKLMFSGLLQILIFRTSPHKFAISWGLGLITVVV